jgi:hypothetical protein
MAFDRDEVSDLLVRCHRRCCICHRFCGVKIETDHIVLRDDGGSDEIQNAIPVCFECHADIHAYNDRHPRGRKFLPDELHRHKEQWLELCRQHPEAVTGERRDTGVGPLQALIDELEFNMAVGITSQGKAEDRGCTFLDDQFRRAMHDGAIALLDERLKQAVLRAYTAIGRANQHIQAIMIHGPDTNEWAGATNRAAYSTNLALEHIKGAHRELLKFLSRDDLSTDPDRAKAGE